MGSEMFIRDRSYSFAHYAGLLAIDGLITLSALVLLRVAMVAAYDLLRRRVQNARKLETALIYGTDDKAISFVRTMEQSPKYNVAGFLVFGDSDKGHVIAGKHVYRVSGEREFAAVAHARQTASLVKGTADAAVSVHQGNQPASSYTHMTLPTY